MQTQEQRESKLWIPSRQTDDYGQVLEELRNGLGRSASALEEHFGRMVLVHLGGTGLRIMRMYVGLRPLSRLLTRGTDYSDEVFAMQDFMRKHEHDEPFKVVPWFLSLGQGAGRTPPVAEAITDLLWPAMLSEWAGDLKRRTVILNFNLGGGSGPGIANTFLNRSADDRMYHWCMVLGAMSTESKADVVSTMYNLLSLSGHLPAPDGCPRSPSRRFRSGFPTILADTSLPAKDTGLLLKFSQDLASLYATTSSGQPLETTGPGTIEVQAWTNYALLFPVMEAYLATGGEGIPKKVDLLTDVRAWVSQAGLVKKGINFLIPAIWPLDQPWEDLSEIRMADGRQKARLRERFIELALEQGALCTGTDWSSARYLVFIVQGGEHLWLSPYGEIQFQELQDRAPQAEIMPLYVGGSPDPDLFRLLILGHVPTVNTFRLIGDLSANYIEGVTQESWFSTLAFARDESFPLIQERVESIATQMETALSEEGGESPEVTGYIKALRANAGTEALTKRFEELERRLELLSGDALQAAFCGLLKDMEG